MGHWRDNGIGNQAGSDDRPASEFTLMEKLAALGGYSDPGSSRFSIAEVAQDAFDEMQELKSKLEGRDDRLDKLEAQCTDLFRQLRAFRESRNDGLATANHAIVNLIERVDRLKEQLDALPTLTDVRQIHSRINRLSGTLNDLGGITADAAHTTPQSTIIHAGWVNIYREPDGSMNTGCLYDSKERAIGFAVKPDHLKHIACIRIPAFKEGEGL